jgi:ribosome recycling factor
LKAVKPYEAHIMVAVRKATKGLRVNSNISPVNRHITVTKNDMTTSSRTDLLTRSVSMFDLSFYC